MRSKHLEFGLLEEKAESAQELKEELNHYNLEWTCLCADHDEERASERVREEAAERDTEHQQWVCSATGRAL